MRYWLKLTLLSDATFGRGDGVAGLVDSEVEHDPLTGLPYIRGRTIKGLLVEECANILHALGQFNPPRDARFSDGARFLFGQSGETSDGGSRLRVSQARLPSELVQAVATSRLTPAEVLGSLTAIRRQTAVAAASGSPDEGSLRSMRVVLRNTTFHSLLTVDDNPPSSALPLVAACVLALRRGGTGRNRGRGRLQAELLDESGQEVTQRHFRDFQERLEDQDEGSTV